MRCRICGSDAIIKIGEVELVADYRWVVQDCRACGCRFTPHDQSVYDRLHRSGTMSYYGEYRDLASNARRLFDSGNRRGLSDLLSTFAKYRFVIEHVETQPTKARLLEVGCSRGYLTSYLILSGRDILAADASAEAIETAKAYFGPHFVLADSPLIAASAPYDLIFHVGTIGCVADPIAFTRCLLRLLKPGGRLVFNAPNVEHCRMPGQLWIDAAPPPDLTTLFPCRFWAEHFLDLAETSTEIEMLPSEAACALWLRKLSGRNWQPRRLGPIESDGSDAKDVRFSGGSGTRGAWQLLEKAVRRAVRVTRIASLVPDWAAPFGQFVTMTRNREDPSATQADTRSPPAWSEA